ncbi:MULTISPECIES: carotenoid oxygenase family protein [unclassified Streptomyces]|uniref:carotenoid oxygenase family protein n=1 Tax=unclassified Streptomyces TaxID=2593676 RepID=UPI002E81259D|nr:carotenoid oxygenase family protein [Streptomyces sp. NBC_00589]WTI41628.1 carotenoid oxygenase family protein [Streptomyces sp. NBC_00775]WUB24689.1 carotenoid oxygenase family protein [Streptomyces sp. NBC_00589]
MTDHTRRTVLRGAAVTAAAGLVGGVSGRAATAGPRAQDTHQFPFLEGAFKPVTEELTAFDLPVTGRIPRELNGRFLRNGPNVLGLEDPRAHHWMLGDGMVHGVRLREGRAEWYRNRWVRSASVAKKLGEPYPGPVPPDDFPCNTHVIGYKGRILALQESGPLPYELDHELNTVGTYDFRSTLKGAFTAHTKFDAAAGELHAIAYYPAWDHVRHQVIDHTGRLVRTTRIPVADAPMMHDFALTEKYVVIFDLPITFDPAGAERGDIVPYVWNEKHPTRVGLLPRAGGEVRWFEVDPVYYSHTLNAYDEGSSVVVDMTTYPAPFYVAGRGSDGPYGAGTASLQRWTIDVAHGRVRTRTIDDRPQEFPRIREELVSRRHRYAYTAAAADMTLAYLTLDGNPPDRAFGNALIKHDLCRGTTQVHRLPRDAAAGEAVFVPSQGARAEDDGYAIAYVHNPDRGAADLVILAAQDFTGEPVARIHLPGRVPLGFHGSWIPDA